MRRSFALAAAIALCAAPLIGVQSAGAVVSEPSGGSTVSAGSTATEQIQGSGSTWAENAINQWVADVQANGLQVVYTGDGSAQGRADFRNDVTDFAVSDIGFQGVDKSTGNNDTSCQKWNPLADCRAYAYLPIVAGGTSFPYQIRVDGTEYKGLRLSGKTVAKIFTNQITNWDNAEITADNNGFPNLPGHHLPSTQIIPVVDSEGSGSSAQFTEYLATEYPSYWRAFAGSDTSTEYFPRQGAQRAEAGSDGIINFITSSAGNGTIGYDEYSYALGQNWPVALLGNKAGYFVAPTQYDVAVALTKAKIIMTKGPDYLLQHLNDVYTDPDERAYPLSSYSYMIIPTSGTDPRVGKTAAPKAQTLADFIDWSVCGGQREMGPIGYSPLPINLAQASFEQMYKLHTADPAVGIKQLNIAKDCHNPTFWAGHSLSANYLAHIAQNPPACDKAGQGPCTGSSGSGSTGNPGKNGKPPANPSSSPTPGTGSHSPGASSSPGSTSSSSPGTSSGGGPPGGSTTTGGNGPPAGTVADAPASLAESDSSGIGSVLAVLAGVELVLLLAIPAVVARRRQLRDTAGPGRRDGA